MRAANRTDAGSPTATVPISASVTEEGTCNFVMSEIVMKPLVELTPLVALEVDPVPDDPVPDEPVPVEDEPVPVDDDDDDEDDPDATAAEPGAAPTVPLTVITVPAIGDVRVQRPRFACAVVTAVWAVFTASCP